MNREEAIKIFQLMKKILSIPNSDAARTIEAIDMAIEALQAEAVSRKDIFTKLKAEAILHGLSDSWIEMLDNAEKEVSRIEAEKVVDIEHKLADMVSVVRCKDCRHRNLFSCPLADNDFQKDEDFCSWGERRSDE